MKIQLLPSTFDEDGRASKRQHLACFVVNDRIAFDAGSLATGTSELQKQQIRDVVLSHAHLDHIAGLPLFIDDLFASLKAPIRIHAAAEVVETLEQDIFNWRIYPRFSELNNEFGAVVEYREFIANQWFTVGNLEIQAVPVNHKVPSYGFFIKENETCVALTNDTAQMSDFWAAADEQENLSALLIECAFPDEMCEIAESSHHLTPLGLVRELKKFPRRSVPIYIINMKPMYREQIVGQIERLKIENLRILEVGKIYEF